MQTLAVRLDLLEQHIELRFAKLAEEVAAERLSRSSAFSSLSERLEAVAAQAMGGGHVALASAMLLGEANTLQPPTPTRDPSPRVERLVDERIKVQSMQQAAATRDLEVRLATLSRELSSAVESHRGQVVKVTQAVGELGRDWPLGSFAEFMSCQALRDTTLGPGFWRPAVIMNSLDLSLQNLRPPPVHEQAQLDGFCSAGRLSSQDFQWEKPVEGGDWIATTETSSISLSTGGDRCRLTSLAIGSTEPTLRLQFEDCAGKAAVAVMLKPVPQGLKLVPWMCAVSQGTDLCTKAAQMARNVTIPPSMHETLDLAALGGPVSEGMLHTNARSACFENLNWFMATGTLGVDQGDWAMLDAIRKLLAPKEVPKMNVEVEVQVSKVCFLSCTGQWGAACGVKPKMAFDETATTMAPLEVMETPVLSRARLEKFGEVLMDTDTAPWAWLVLILGLLVGTFLAMLLYPVFRSKEPAKKGPLRYKQVELLNPDNSTAAILRCLGKPEEKEA
ncbi:unnamed protein product [Effrenium voratum]|nr:unnamed protein product [Effrenium voratum]